MFSKRFFGNLNGDFSVSSTYNNISRCSGAPARALYYVVYNIIIIYWYTDLICEDRDEQPEDGRSGELAGSFFTVDGHRRRRFSGNYSTWRLLTATANKRKKKMYRNRNVFGWSIARHRCSAGALSTTLDRYRFYIRPSFADRVEDGVLSERIFCVPPNRRADVTGCVLVTRLFFAAITK